MPLSPHNRWKGNKMKDRSRTTLAALAIVFSTGGVQAADYDWGLHVLAPAQETALAVGGGGVGAGSFLDTYLFSLATPGIQASSVVVAINLLTSNISDGSYSLFSTTDYGTATLSDDVLVGGGWSFDGASGSTVNTVTSLGSGNYYFAVSGVGGAGGGQYLLNSSVAVAPIPEPEIYAMLGVGLGLLGWVGRRKKLQAA
jgi:hypothetical protein